MSLQNWAVPRLSPLLSLDDAGLREVVQYAATLPPAETAAHFRSLLGESPAADDFIELFNIKRHELATDGAAPSTDSKATGHAPPLPDAAASSNFPYDTKTAHPEYTPPAGPPPGASSSSNFPYDTKTAQPEYTPPTGPPPSASTYAPPPGPPPSSSTYAPPPGPPPAAGSTTRDEKHDGPPGFDPPSYPPPSSDRAVGANGFITSPPPRPHTNAVIRAGQIRAKDEQQMQNWLQNLQYQLNIYNSEIEPEHDCEYYCNCPIHQYIRAKWNRLPTLELWAKAVMYPGEKSYHDCTPNGGATLFTRNPYLNRVVSPYGNGGSWGPQRPQPYYHTMYINQTIQLNRELNAKAQRDIDAQEPQFDIWADDDFESALSRLNLSQAPTGRDVKGGDEKRGSVSGPPGDQPGGKSKFSMFKKSIGIKSSEERAVSRFRKEYDGYRDLREAILQEEAGRWQDDITRQIVATYQQKVGMAGKIAHLRQHQPIQYLHLLRAGYFEPIPVAWAGDASNPLKFSIEAGAGWRGITPAWRGFEDTAEERLYWVLNHREGSGTATRMKPDFISEMNMARERMARAVEPPPEYYSANDVCHTQHTSKGYSRQVMPSPFRPFDRPEQATDDTMILLDVSGSMDFDPVRPVYEQYMVKSYVRTTQPKNKDVARAVIRRFADAMANHDHQFKGYDLTTFSSRAEYVGCVNHQNLDQLWSRIHIGGGTRVMTGWQKVKDLHFHKHAASAIHHPVFGWQAGPQTPMLRLLLLLDGEATDMDEFELDLLGLSWAHVTIFLIGADGCPHHHRHANELQRISDVNHHVSFVDAQGNCPERFVTHELLKRHLGYEISMNEFQAMEELPSYSET